jgi:ferric-dicitrate binding protein FerR (iron transport regulator)
VTDERKTADAPETACERLGDLAAASAPGASGAPDGRQWASIEARLDRPPWRRGVGRRWPWLAVASIVLTCAVGWFALRRTLSYQTHACVVSADGWLRSLDQGVVAFEDGTKIDLEPSSRMRVRPLAFARGAELFLADGEARLSVVHRRDARWAVVAGPFRARVTGTRFSVRWSESRGQLRVVVAEGEVEVSGGPLQGDTRLHTGQALEAETGRFAVQDAPSASLAPTRTVAPPAGQPTPDEPARSSQPAPAAERPHAPATATSIRRKASAPRRATQPGLTQPSSRADDGAAAPRGIGESVSSALPALAPTVPMPAPPVAAPPRLPARPGPLRVGIAPDGRLSGGVTGFAWVEAGEGAEFSMPVAKQEHARLPPTDGQLCAHGRLSRWACINEGTPHIRCNWDRNWGVAIGFFVRSDRAAWSAEAASAISIDFRGRSAAYRLVAHRKGDPVEKVYCMESYKSGRVVRPAQLKSRCWDDAGDSLPDFRDVESFSLQALSGLEYVAFRYCITGITVYP